MKSNIHNKMGERGKNISVRVKGNEEQKEVRHI